MDEEHANLLVGRVVIVGTFDSCVVDAIAEAFAGCGATLSQQRPPLVILKEEWEAVYLPAVRAHAGANAGIEPFLLAWRVKDRPDTAGDDGLLLLDAFARLRCEARLRCPILMVVYAAPRIPPWKQSSDELEPPTAGSYFWIDVLEIGDPDLIRLRVRPECLEPRSEELIQGDILAGGTAARLLRARLHRVELQREADAARCLSVLRTYRFLLDPWAPTALVGRVEHLLASESPDWRHVLDVAYAVWTACAAEAKREV